MYNSSELKKGISRSIRKIGSVKNERYGKDGKEIGATVKLSVEIHDKIKAIETIAKLLGFMVEKKEHTGANGEPLLPSVSPEQVLDVVTELMKREGRDFD